MAARYFNFIAINVESLGSIPRPVKSDKVSQKAPHHRDVSSDVLLRRYDTGMDPPATGYTFRLNTASIIQI